MTKPQEPVVVWGDDAEPKLSDVPLKMAEGYCDANYAEEDLYIQDANGDEWARQDGKWVEA